MNYNRDKWKVNEFKGNEGERAAWQADIGDKLRDEKFAAFRRGAVDAVGEDNPADNWGANAEPDDFPTVEDAYNAGWEEGCATWPLINIP